MASARLSVNLPPLGATSNSSDRNSSLPFPPAGGVEFSTAAL
ncbi:hypothetical protein [Microcoleus sp. A2-C2]